MYKMNRSFFAGRFASTVFAVLALASMVFSQSTLRKAIDYDNDQKADLVVYRPSDATWYILKSSGVINIQAFGIANEDYRTPGDFDGDGIGDIAVWRDNNGTWYWISSQNSTFNVIQWGLAGDEPVARDYNGDGRTDLAVVRRSGGIMTWYVFLLGVNGFFSTNFGLDGDFVVPGDFDGDGKFDFAVQRPGATPTSPATYYFSNSEGYTFYEFGQTKDLIAPGDYDGDGKTDLAVVREGDLPTDILQWYIRLSGSSGAVANYGFGLTGTDLLVQNDYDGDGKCDIAVWRNSNGHFYYLNSGSNFAFSDIWWGLANDEPVASYDTH
jgi:hypothetical protein